MMYYPYQISKNQNYPLFSALPQKSATTLSHIIVSINKINMVFRETIRRLFTTTNVLARVKNALDKPTNAYHRLAKLNLSVHFACGCISTPR